MSKDALSPFRRSAFRRSVFRRFAAQTLVPALALALLAVACQPQSPESSAALDQETAAAVPAALEGDALVARGEYLVTVSGCHDCHTPWVMGPEGPHPDMTRPLSGHPQDLVISELPAAAGGPWMWAGAATNTAFAGPWGVSFATNLTSSPEGMGAVDPEMFVQAMRTGKHWGAGRPILPPMPWPNVAKMTDEDLAAVYAYLRTVPPSPNVVPEPILAPPPTTVPAS